jgi:hypothetical protein
MEKHWWEEFKNQMFLLHLEPFIFKRLTAFYKM